MRHTVNKPLPSQGSTRLLPPPRAVSSANGVPSAPSQPPPAPQPTAPAHSPYAYPPPAVQHPNGYAPGAHEAAAPANMPLAYGSQGHLNGAPYSANGAGVPAPGPIGIPPPQGNPYAGMAASDLSQRLLMDQMAMLQRQLLDMAALVATTQVQNQALLNQVGALTQQVQGLASGAAAPAAANPPPAPTAPHADVTTASTAAEPAMGASTAAPEPGSAAEPAAAPVYEVRHCEEQPLAEMQPAVTEQTGTQASTTMVSVPVAQAVQKEEVRVAEQMVSEVTPVTEAEMSPAAAPAPAVASAPGATAAAASEAAARTGATAPVEATAAAAPAASPPGDVPPGRVELQVQQLSQVAAQLQTLYSGLAAQAVSGMPAAATPDQAPSAATPDQAPSAESLSPSPASPLAAAAAASSNGVAADASAPTGDARSAGRGGQYAGAPPRGGQQPSAHQGAGAGAAPGSGADGAATDSRSRQAPRGGRGQAGASKGAAGGGGTPGASYHPVSALDTRIRRCASVAELRVLAERDDLNVFQVVLAARQLPRLARQCQEREQEEQLTALQAAVAQATGQGETGPPPMGAKIGPNGGTAAADAELAAIKELFLKLVARLCNPRALTHPSPNFLPNYLALAAVSAELRTPPSRAFITALRQLVSQHVATLSPEHAAGGVAAIAQLEGAVAPGVLEKACAVITSTAPAATGDDGSSGDNDTSSSAGAGVARRLFGWRALVAAGQLAPLGKTAVDAARHVLSGAAETAAALVALGAPPPADLDEEALAAAAQGLLACTVAGVAVPAVLLGPLEAAACREGVLARMGPKGQLLLAKAFIAAGYQPQDPWLDAWEAAAVATRRRATRDQVAAQAAALHTLTRTNPAVRRLRPVFAGATAARLLTAGRSYVAGSGSSACALALHLGELACDGGAGSAGSASAVPPPPDATQLGYALLHIARGSLPSLDVPDLAALVTGLSLLEVPAPPEVWSAILSRASDAPASVAAVAAAARRALNLGLPAGIKPESLEQFLTVASLHVGELPAASLVGLLGLGAAVKARTLRPSLLASMMVQLHGKAVALRPHDAALLFAAVDALSLHLSQPMVARLIAQGGGSDGAAAADLTPAAVLHRVAAAALVPEAALQALGVEATAHLLELVARLQQAATTAAGGAGAEGAEAPASEGDGADSNPSSTVISRRQLLDLVQLLQAALPSASSQALACISGAAAALALQVPQTWVDELVGAMRTALPVLDPLTAARIAAAVTRCERLAGTALGTSGGGSDWLDAFVDDARGKLAAAPPAALALTLQVLVAHGRRPPADWTTAFLSAASAFLEAPLPLTQAQAAGAAAVAASLAAGRTLLGAAAGKKAAKVQRKAGAASSQGSSTTNGTQGAVAAAAAAAPASFTAPQLSQVLGGLAALQMGDTVPPAWLKLAVQQVEGRAVQFSYADLAEALYGVVQLGGEVRESLGNQLLIVSQAKLAEAPPSLLSRTMVVVAGADGAKVSSKWWDDAQKVLAVQLRAAAPVGARAGAVTAWQPKDVAQVVAAALRLRRMKAGAEVGPQLAVAMAAAVKSSDTVAAALSPESALLFVEACAAAPQQFGAPPPSLVAQYLSYSSGVLASWSGDAALAAAAAANEAAASTAAPELGQTGKRKAKERRAREREAKHAAAGAAGTGSVPKALLEHLPYAVAVGRLLLDTPVEQRPEAATPWLAALAAAGGAAASSLPRASAAGLLLLLAKLESRAGDGVIGPEEEARREAMRPMLELLAERVGRGATAKENGEGTAASRGRGGFGSSAGAAADSGGPQRLSLEAVVDTVWALRTLDLHPSDGLVRDLARALPKRLASLPPADGALLLQTLAYYWPAVVVPSAGSGAAATPMPLAAFTQEVSRLIETLLLTPVTHGSMASPPSHGSGTAASPSNLLLIALEAAAIIELELPAPLVAEAAGRVADMAAAGSLWGPEVYTITQALQHLHATPPADQLAALAEAAATRALDGTLGGVMEIAQAVSALYDMGLRPEQEWLEAINEAVVAALATDASLNARRLVMAFEMLACRLDGLLPLALAACQVVMVNLQKQLGVFGGLQGEEQGEGSENAVALSRQALAEAAAAAEEGVDGVGSSHTAAAEDVAPQSPEEQEQGVVEEDDLDDFLWEPVDLPLVVQLLQALINSRALQPPEDFYALVEAAVRPMLRGEQQGQGQQQQGQRKPAVVAASGGGSAAEFEECLQHLVHLFKLLDHVPSAAFLQDLEAYLGSRMTVQNQSMLAAFAVHCKNADHIPTPDFMRALMARAESLLPVMKTGPALGLMEFMLYVKAFKRQDPDGRWNDTMQALMNTTSGQELVELSQVNIEQASELAGLLVVLIGQYGLDLPHTKSPEKLAVWARAVQALIAGRFADVGWGNVGCLMTQLQYHGVQAEQQWLADMYRCLDADAASIPVLQLAEAAFGAGYASFQIALAPTLPARLASTLESRMREFAEAGPHPVVRMLQTLGYMGHVLRTEVLQAAEAIMAPPLARAPGSLVAAQRELAVRPGDESALAERDAAVVLLDETNIAGTCQALMMHAYRPGRLLLDALMAAVAHLNANTPALTHPKELERLQQRRDICRWEGVTQLPFVLDFLALPDVRPSQEWWSGMATAFLNAMRCDAGSFYSHPDGDFLAFYHVLRAAVVWDRCFTGEQLEQLEAGLVNRVLMLGSKDIPFNESLTRRLGTAVEAMKRPNAATDPATREELAQLLLGSDPQEWVAQTEERKREEEQAAAMVQTPAPQQQQQTKQRKQSRQQQQPAAAGASAASSSASKFWMGQARGRGTARQAEGVVVTPAEFRDLSEGAQQGRGAAVAATAGGQVAHEEPGEQQQQRGPATTTQQVERGPGATAALTVDAGEAAEELVQAMQAALEPPQPSALEAPAPVDPAGVSLAVGPAVAPPAVSESTPTPQPSRPERGTDADADVAGVGAAVGAPVDVPSTRAASRRSTAFTSQPLSGGGDVSSGSVKLDSEAMQQLLQALSSGAPQREPAGDEAQDVGMEPEGQGAGEAEVVDGDGQRRRREAFLAALRKNPPQSSRTPSSRRSSRSLNGRGGGAAAQAGKGFGASKLAAYKAAASGGTAVAEADPRVGLPSAGRAMLDPNDPTTWKLLDRELDSAGPLEVVEPEVIEPGVVEP